MTETDPELPVLDVAGLVDSGGQTYTFSLARGEAVALLAPGGSGKRWLLRVVAGLRSPGSGSVRSRAERSAYVFSSGGLLSNVSVLENLVLPLRFCGVPLREARSRAMDVLTGLGLVELAELRPPGLAADALHLIQFGRAMALRADLLFLEEPFRYLPAATADEVAAWLRDELERRRVSVVLTTPDPHDAERLGARVVRVGGEGGTARAFAAAEGR